MSKVGYGYSSAHASYSFLLSTTRSVFGSETSSSGKSTAPTEVMRQPGLIHEEFWYGNIEPTEYDTSACKEYKEALRLITKNEEKLQATMTNEQKKLFSRYTDAVHEHQMITDCLIFQNGFNLGARIMLEIMEE